MGKTDLENLAALIKERNKIASRITAIIGRPAQIGHVGEYIASHIFDIRLEQSATQMGFDGVFASGQLEGKTVNIKFYGKREHLLDINPDALPDYFLVMTGPKGNATSSLNEKRLWSIDWVFLFESKALLSSLKTRKVKIGVATSIITEFWQRAEIYPKPSNPIYVLDNHQRENLSILRQK